MPTRPCPVCYKEIPFEAFRCDHCRSPLAPPSRRESSAHVAGPPEGGGAPDDASKAQARYKLWKAEFILVACGAVIGLLGLTYVATYPAEVARHIERETARLQGRGVQIPAMKALEIQDAAREREYLFSEGFIACGGLIFVFGVFLKANPLPFSILSLLIFVGTVVVWGAFHPYPSGRMILVALILFVALLRATVLSVEFAATQGDRSPSP